MSNELAILESVTKLNALEVFKPEKVSDILDKIKAEARSIVIDISTEAGRKECASTAYKIARSKTALDNMGKDLVEGWKTQAKAIDAERKRIRDELDALKDEIRAPLTELENREKEHEAALVTLSTFSRLEGDETLEQIKDRISGEERYFTGREWELFSARANFQHTENVKALQEAYDRRKKYEDDQAELVRLRKEQEERDRKEREERIASESAAAAAKAERDRIESEKKAEADAAAKREADKKHRAKINNEILAALREHCGADEEVAKATIAAIARGQIPHVKINY